MNKRTEFPALDARRSYLEHAAYEARRQADDAAFEGKFNVGTQQWLASIRAELDELIYVLKIVGSHGSRIEVTGHTLVAVSIVFAAVMLAVFYITFVGH